jgi:transposase
VLEEDPQVEEIVARVAALDIGKAEVVCCVRVPQEGKPGRRCQEVATYSTMTRSLLGMADHLRCLGVSRVVMEATGASIATCVTPCSTSHATISTSTR